MDETFADISDETSPEAEGLVDRDVAEADQADVAPPTVTFSVGRAGFVLFSTFAILVALVGRVAYLQTINRDRTLRQADRQQHQTVTLRARRGCIYDTNGILMAGTVQTRTLYADPKFMQGQFGGTTGHSLVQMDDAVARLAELVDKQPVRLEPAAQRPKRQPLRQNRRQSR